MPAIRGASADVLHRHTAENDDFEAGTLVFLCGEIFGVAGFGAYQYLS
jgi:hypothetical protein